MRRYASAVLAVALCLSVCHKSDSVKNGWTDRSDFCSGRFFWPVLPSGVRKFVTFQNNGTSLWNFVPNSRLREFCHVPLIVATCCQLGSTLVNARCGKTGDDLQSNYTHNTCNIRPSTKTLASSSHWALKFVWHQDAWVHLRQLIIVLCRMQRGWW